MKFKAPAKINLCLDVLKKDKSGYHIIQTVYHEVKNLADEIEITLTKNKDIIEPFNPPKIKAVIFPQKSDDLIYKALMLVKKTFKVKKFVKIKVKKNIPFASGLGGGSSDAAAVLKGLNKLWKLKLSKEQLANLGMKLGMDVPFFIYGGTALGEHYGEKITKLPTVKNVKFEIYPRKSPIVGKKTKTKYEKLNLKKCSQNLNQTRLLIKGIKTRNQNLITENLHNDFETIVKISKSHHLSGSGPSTFTVRQSF